MTKTARVLIVDDHEIVRMGLRILLAGYPQFEICGEAADGRQALAKVADLLPDVVIMDLSMPVINGFDAARELRQTRPATKICAFQHARNAHYRPYGRRSRFCGQICGGERSPCRD